jgi:phosphatidate cytidylyltransferase
MNKLVQRILMFVVAVPLTICLIMLFPQRHHLVANVAVMVLSALGAVELAGLFKTKGAAISLIEAALLGMTGPIGMTLVASFEVKGQIVPGILILGASWVIVSRILSREENLHKVMGYVSAAFSIIFYPGIFMAWIIAMTQWSHASLIILSFMLTVVANDSAAWACGVLWGKNNRGVIAASPNKSVAGFIGGSAASMLIGLGAALLLPDIFTPERLPLSRALAGIVLGLFSGIAASLGDLGESALKRSVRVKDSGSIIPGRGGVLDSIDSIALAAPVYYVIYWFLFT